MWKILNQLQTRAPPPTTLLLAPGAPPHAQALLVKQQPPQTSAAAAATVSVSPNATESLVGVDKQALPSLSRRMAKATLLSDILPPPLLLQQQQQAKIQVLHNRQFNPSSAILAPNSSPSTSTTSSSLSAASGLSPLPPSPTSSEQQANGYSRFKGEFNMIDRIGKGGFGVVYRCANLLDQVEYAIKMLPVRSGDSSTAEALKKARTMARMSHPNVVRYYSTWMEGSHLHPVTGYSGNMDNIDSDEDYDDWSRDAVDDDPDEVDDDEPSTGDLGDDDRRPLIGYLFIQMELCDKGTLRSWMRQRSSAINPLECREIIKQVISGLHYIHRQGFVHRDITPDNIFLFHSPLVAKIGDFGLAESMEHLKLERERVITAATSEPGPTGNEPVGTYLYSSPEQEAGQSYSQMTDIFSVGVIYYELLASFKTEMERVMSLSALKRVFTLPTSFKSLFPKESAFIERILQPHATRPSSSQLINDQFLLEDISLQCSLIQPSTS